MSKLPLLVSDQRLNDVSPMDYFGYFGGNDPKSLGEMEQEGVNCVSPNNVIYIPEIRAGVQVDPYLLGQEKARSFKANFADTTLYYDICLGAWNNGLFPYLPEWYLEQHPEIIMRDSTGNPIMASMFGNEKPWINIEYGPYNAEIDQFMQGFIAEFGLDERMAYWVTGGEMLYPTYVFPERDSDYSALSRTHFQAWLQKKYQTIHSLNTSWGNMQHIAAFGEIVPPAWDDKTLRGLDWQDFRMIAMAEYFQKQYETVINSSATEPLLAILHGDLFHDYTYKEMGQSVYWMSQVSDGLATSQILFNRKKPDFNHLMLQFISSTGKLATSQALACVSEATEGQIINNSFTPWDVRRAVYECLGMGIWHAGLVQWKGDLPDGNWQIAGTAAQQEVRDVMRELQTIKADIHQMARLKPTIGILYSEATWLLDGWLQEWTLLNQATLSTHVSYLSLFDFGLAEQLESGDIQAIIVPYANCLRPEVSASLRKFVQNGGTLVLLDDNEGLGTASRHADMGWELPFADLPWSFAQQDASHRFEVASAAEGNGEICWIKSKFNRVFLQRIFYAQETQVLQMWQFALDILAKRGYEKPLSGVPSQVESLELSNGTDLAIVFINRSTETVNFPLKIASYLIPLNAQAEVKDLINDQMLSNGDAHSKGNVISLEGLSTKVIKVSTNRGEMKTSGHATASVQIIEQGADFIRIKVTQENEQTAGKINVTGKVAPLFDYVLKANDEGNDIFHFSTNREQLPPIYDHLQSRYVPYKGRIQLKLTVSGLTGEVLAYKTIFLGEI